MTMQPAATLPVDADLWWINYLRATLATRSEPFTAGVYLDRRVPTTRRDRMVICRRDGGNVSGLFDRPRVALDVWAKTEQDASDLAALVIALALRAPVDAPGVVRVAHLSGPNSVADPSGQPRRLALIEATHRTAVLGA